MAPQAGLATSHYNIIWITVGLRVGFTFNLIQTVAPRVVLNLKSGFITCSANHFEIPCESLYMAS